MTIECIVTNVLLFTTKLWIKTIFWGKVHWVSCKEEMTNYLKLHLLLRQQKSAADLAKICVMGRNYFWKKMKSKSKGRFFFFFNIYG